ncbi:enoyl-CoA hydratase-related protein [Pseudonocardia nematodicida]|uniref:Enoyl-CoA hydratase-related protein n=1 Tax=Pseudonocardia nematodicida TaxID=1206997 RepID=A0ABV1KER6_9PSEU
MSAVYYEQNSGVARITLDAPERGNPLNPTSVAELADAVRRARADDSHVVVLSATGDTFCVGGDLTAFAGADDVEHMIDDLAEALHRVISDLHRIAAVVVSVVQGTTAGAGVPLAAAADLVLASTSARFTLAYTGVGLSPDGGTSLLTASLGLHRTLRLALLNPVVTAEEAHALGLVAEVHPDDELDAAVEATVAGLRRGSRSAQIAAKRLLREAATPGEEAALRRETLSIRALAASPDGREGVAAFLAKRAPGYPSSCA